MKTRLLALFIIVLESSDSSMVDENQVLMGGGITGGQCSDSSMVDENPGCVPCCQPQSCVQIPLWSMKTRRGKRRERSLLRSDSSMVDENFRHCQPKRRQWWCSDSSMVDENVPHYGAWVVFWGVQIPLWSMKTRADW